MPEGGGSPGSGGLSSHPDDVLIRQLAVTGRQATSEEIARIAQRVATAPFDERIRKVPVKNRGLTYRGVALGERAASLDYHLVKRVVVEGQWAEGTTGEQYVADLRRAASLPHARVVVYEDRGGAVATVIAPRSDVAPDICPGPDPQALVVVIHSADRGIMVTGYQASGLDTLRIPEGAQWLR
jgi:hypothetical protein